MSVDRRLVRFVVRRVLPVLKVTVFVLLAFNIVLFLETATVPEALEELGWVIVLSVMMYETSALHEDYASRFEQYGIYAAQVVGYGFALYATWHYWNVGDALSFLNAATWLAVSALLAYDVYAPGEYGDREWYVRNWLKAALYAAVFVYAVLWGWEGFTGGGGLAGLLDFYDASLWIVCFAIVERRVFDYEMQEEIEAIAAASSS
jgi:hypothetical protein